MINETLIRSAVKSLCWRISGFIILGIISYSFTGLWTESLLISGWFNGIRFVLYIFHERLWNKIKWGKE
jgi:uncharacterized membrane protein